MSDFKFIQNPLSKKWVILAPRRAQRPDAGKDSNIGCPFCPGREKEEREVYRIGGKPDDSNWQTRVLNNKFPFAQIHEIIVHSPDHHKNFGELDLSSVELIFKTYRQRYQTHAKDGKVYIFHNRGEKAGESLPHPHSQLVVVPENMELQIPVARQEKEYVETDHFFIFCPKTSDWPDEVWIKLKKESSNFGDITDEEIADISNALSRLIQILDLRHGNEFPFNFYISSEIKDIYPGENWYLRLIPRLKTLGGFELGTNVYVNTQDPSETIAFLKEHFENPNIEKIKTTHQASYKKAI